MAALSSIVVHALRALRVWRRTDLDGAARTRLRTVREAMRHAYRVVRLDTAQAWKAREL